MIKLPRTQHIEGSRLPKGKPDPEAVQFPELNGKLLVIEEKVDGTGVCIFFDDNANPQIWHRGSMAIGKEYRQLHDWVIRHQDRLFTLLENRYLLFGEWMLNKHTIFYDQLPHYFLESDIYDQRGMIWLSTEGRKAVTTGHHDYIKSVPVIATITPTELSQITSLVGKSQYQSENWNSLLWHKCEMMDQDFDKVLQQTDQSGLMEGLYIKHESDRHVMDRYKYVRYEFVETIVNSGSHLIDREPLHNVALGGYSCLL
jgi:hypothetical protein